MFDERVVAAPRRALAVAQEREITEDVTLLVEEESDRGAIDDAAAVDRLIDRGAVEVGDAAVAATAAVEVAVTIAIDAGTEDNCGDPRMATMAVDLDEDKILMDLKCSIAHTLGLEPTMKSKMHLFRLKPESLCAASVANASPELVYREVDCEMGAASLIRTYLPIDPPAESVHVLAVLRTRRISYVVLGRCVPSSVLHVDIDASASIWDLKTRMKLENPDDFAVVNKADQLHLYLARKHNTWLANASPEVAALTRGDTAQVQEIMTDDSELDSMDWLDEHFPVISPRDSIQVLVALPVTELRCMIAGIPGDPFCVFIENDAYINDLVAVLKQHTRLQDKDNFEVAVAHFHGIWLDLEGEDVRALALGEATKHVRGLLDSFCSRTYPCRTIQEIFHSAPRCGVIHVLVLIPGVRVRDVLPSALAKRKVQEGWDKLNASLNKRQKKKESCSDNPAIFLRDVTWADVSSSYVLQNGIRSLPIRTISTTSLALMKDSLVEAVRALPAKKNGTETKWLLSSLLFSMIRTEAANLKVSGGYRLTSNGGRENASGSADFLVYNEAKNASCVIMVGEDPAGSSDDICKTELAQTLVAMEIMNTQSTGKFVKGILTNYRSWAFVDLEYPPDSASQTVVRLETDFLVTKSTDIPTDTDLRRVVGKFFSVLRDD